MDKTTELTTVDTAKPLKIPQPHGGALNAHGTPGTRGGVGRAPSEVRRMAREMFTAQLPVLDAIAEGRVIVPLVERCAKCGYEPTDEDEQKRAKALYHLTHRGNAPRMAKASRIDSAATLMRYASCADLVRVRRDKPMSLRIGADMIWLRDHRPLVEANIAFEGGWGLGDLIESINRRVFFLAR
jgi:hypothetical protein